VPIQTLHGLREPALLDLEEKVVVSRHEAEGKARNTLSNERRAEDADELDVVLGSTKEWETAGRSRTDVIDPGCRGTWRSRHVGSVPGNVSRGSQHLVSDTKGV
jgi:hypothetical protein